jgi:hypothetical protein
VIHRRERDGRTDFLNELSNLLFVRVREGEILDLAAVEAHQVVVMSL